VNASRTAWPVVCIVLGALASVTVLAVTHAVDPALLSFISAAVVPTVTMLLVGSGIQGQVNGRMSQLIDALAAAQQQAVSIAAQAPPPKVGVGAP
jgi:hypothetical protein